MINSKDVLKIKFIYLLLLMMGSTKTCDNKRFFPIKLG